MRKKILILLLCCALVSGLVPTVNINAYAQEPEQTLLVYQDGEAVTEAALPVSQKITLQANVYPEDFAAQSYQWQIQVPGGVWVDIAGEVQKTINLTYGMVASLLDSDSAVQVRCKLIDDSVGAMLSNEVRVTVDSSQPLPELPLENGTVLREAEAVANPAPAQDETPAASDNDQTAPADNTDSDTSAPSTEPQAPADNADTNANADAPAASEEATAPAADADAPAADADTQPAASADTPADEPAPAPADAANAPADDLNNAKADLDSSPSDVMDTLPTPVDALDQIKSTLQDAAATLADETGETENDEKDTYSIIINYVFADGKQAANPWTATVAKGSSYSVTVTSPTVVGYAPDQTSVEIDITNIQADKTYTVTYKPAEVGYTVKHYQQNVENDNYTLVETETKTAYTESIVSRDLAKNYTGFYALLYDVTTSVAADGSTEIEIYYDRNYYLMNFDLDGGYGVEPIYARYGSKISVGTPTKAGYEFNGWNGVIPETMPAENRSFKALWQESTAKVTIVFWGENPDDENYSYMDSFEIQSKPGTELRYDPDAIVCGLQEHTHSADCGYNCNMPEHKHDTNCYAGVGNRGNAGIGAPSNPTNGYVARKGWSYNEKVIYINGVWYDYSGNTATGSVAPTTCGKQIHTHSDSCGYSCGKAEHTHNANCKMDKEVDANLWKYVKSDTVTVNGDGSTILNVYYDRTEFTLTFKDGNRTVTKITAKWGAAISGEFSKDPFTSTTYNGRAWLCTDKSKYSYALQTLDRMPKFDATFNLYDKSSNTKKTIYYYVQKVGTTVNADQWPTNSTNFDLQKRVDTYFNYATYDEEYHEMQGFTRYSADVSGFDGNAKDFTNNELNLYYMRNSYTLRFFNRTDYVTEREATVQYEAELKDKNFTPAYPSGLEPNAYEFAGWYTSPGCYDGSKVDWDTIMMPADDLTLYAKWTPKTHTVSTWLTDEMKTAVNVGETNVQTVLHGSNAVAPDEPKNGNYIFIGWFYKDDNGVEKAFNFSMPVNRDLDLYAKWSSNQLVEYTIKYTLEDGTVIASETKGSALAGTTKTFEAKTGTQLDVPYQTGYFPLTNSHSLTMNIDGGNEFTFIYVQKEKVNYTVRYLERGTGTVLHEEKHVETSDAVITEKFVAIKDYRPDAYQKRLVLSADEEENVITFWYEKDTEHAPVQVIHWIQNIEGDEYTVYQSSTDLNAEIGKPYSTKKLDITGFHFKEGRVDQTPKDLDANGELTADVTAEGLVLNLYYDRNVYPYSFRFIEKDTGVVLADAILGNARYQAQVTASAKTIEGYTLVSPENQAINIDIEDSNTAVKNVKVFYYTEQTVDIKYQVIGPDGCGTLDNYQDNGVKVKNGTVKGSTPTANPGYRFVGWFMDEPCLIPVESIITGAVNPATNKMTPQKRPSDNLHFAATYYAKFERALADLTITKSGWDPIDENQSFIFHIEGTDENTKQIDMDVVIHGSKGSVTIKDLPVGRYKVTEKTTWSWRYKPASNGKTVDLQDNQTLPFDNTRTENKWLNGNAFCDNRWMNGSQNKSN